MNLDLKAVKKCQELKAIRNEFANQQLAHQARGLSVKDIYRKLEILDADLRDQHYYILKSLDVL